MFLLKPLFVVALALMLITMPSYAKEKRYALVIGNSDYDTAALKNPVNDATDMAKQLKGFGFNVDKLLNVSKREMEQAISAFGKKLNQENAIGLFYFAGHGVQVDGRNYLMPLGATVADEVDIQYEAVDAGRVLDKMELAGNGLNIVILDACRDNPFTRSTRSQSRGLVRMNAPKGSMILYATSPGDVAQDGKGRNGLFTANLLASMSEPGLKVEDIFKQTAIKVSQQSGKKQVPWVEGVILGDFYFTGQVVVNNPSDNPVPPVASPTVDNTEDLYWSALDHSDADQLKAYLADYPQGKYARIAKIKLKNLNKPKQPVLGKLVISASRSDATIRINGVSKGKVKGVFDLKPGEYYVEVLRDGYRSYKKSVTVKAGTEQIFYARLEKIPVKRPAPPKSTPKPTSYQFSSWMNSDKYQVVWERYKSKRHYPIKTEGRNYNGQEQFRSIWKPYEKGSFWFASFHGMSKSWYEKRKKKYIGKGYREISFQTFKNADGYRRYQAVWVKH